MKRDELEQSKYERDVFMGLSMVSVVIALIFLLLFFKVIDERNMWQEEVNSTHKKIH